MRTSGAIARNTQSTPGGLPAAGRRYARSWQASMISAPPSARAPPRPADPGAIPPRRPATRSWGSWAAAAWASSTRPGSSSLNRLVALKMILAGGHAGAGASCARFRIEAEAVARLQHPNIVQIYEVGEHDGLPFFSLEFVDGGSLAEQARTARRCRRARRRALVETLARAMHYAHGTASSTAT